MGCKLTLAMLTASLLAPAWAPPLQAQRRPMPGHEHEEPLTVEAVNDLWFGTVLPGIPVSVSPRDPRHSGQFEVEGPKDADVRIEFSLPAALVSDHGALLPVSFGPGDGFADFSRGTPWHGKAFNPHSPLIRELGPNGRLFLRLGGTVKPVQTQSGGDYSATISMTVYNLGS
jgi:hypothetical protein